MVASKLGYVGVMGDEVLQKGREMVPLPKGHVTAHEVLMHHSQVEVVAEGVNVHQVPHLITLLGEQHGQLRAETHTNTVTVGAEHTAASLHITCEKDIRTAEEERKQQQEHHPINSRSSNLMKELLYRRSNEASLAAKSGQKTCPGHISTQHQKTINMKLHFA